MGNPVADDRQRPRGSHMKSANGRAMIRSKLRKTDSDGWHRVVTNTSDWTLKDAAV
ncbi:uncharacterized protein CPUR_03447 [Claviceps purpurea 20.1]|uniref:Uncharacterized protein n=1 Tax=Claviceps purpurea (strain 20.1) TaxID=1111077 RepID=M1W509_CLAP2|nr:uncharacterized protein CPUR_03447 [Claviceps purpurea 20.1]